MNECINVDFCKLRNAGTLDGIRTILTELSTTVPAAKNADPEQFVAYKRLYEK